MIVQGQAGALAEFYAGANRPFFFGTGVSTIPVTDFLPNPNTFVADYYNINSSFFGQMNAAFAPRIIQFAMKLNF